MTSHDSTADQPSVVVIGGGYGGGTVAKALDEYARGRVVRPGSLRP
jgi:choline dehydrogenase-like flavoprotein